MVLLLVSLQITLFILILLITEIEISLYLAQEIQGSYQAAGIRVNGVPYKPPHILFWNLGSTSGFPSLANKPNASMMSGFSPALLNLFCEQGLDALQSCTPWSLLVKSLENERYQIMENKLNEIL